MLMCWINISYISFWRSVLTIRSYISFWRHVSIIWSRICFGLSVLIIMHSPFFNRENMVDGTYRRGRQWDMDVGWHKGEVDLQWRVTIQFIHSLLSSCLMLGVHVTHGRLEYGLKLCFIYRWLFNVSNRNGRFPSIIQTMLVQTWKRNKLTGISFSFYIVGSRAETCVHFTLWLVLWIDFTTFSDSSKSSKFPFFLNNNSIQGMHVKLIYEIKCHIRCSQTVVVININILWRCLCKKHLLLH